MPTGGTFALLRWMGRRQARNWLRWTVRRPSFWLMVVSSVVFVVLFSVGPPPRTGPSDPLSIPFERVLPFVALLGSGAILSALVFGPMMTIVARPIVDMVYLAPFARAAVLQARVRRLLVGFAAGIPLFGFVAGLVLSRFVRVPPFVSAGWFALVVLPAIGFAAFAGLLLAYGSSRISERTQNVAVVVGIALLLLSLPSVLTLDFTFWDDPLIVLLTRLSIPATKLFLGDPLEAGDILVLGLAWLGFACVAWLAATWPYELYEDRGTRSIPTEAALSRETAPTAPEAWRRLRLRLRVRYQDLGRGRRALIGRNLTTSLRGPFGLLNVVFVVMLLALLVPMTFSLARSGLLRFQMALMLVGLMVSMSPFIMGGIGADGPQSDLIRLLPLRPLDVLMGYVVPNLGLILIYSVAVAVIAEASGMGAGTAALGFALVFSIGVLAGVWGFVSGGVSGSARLTPTVPGPIAPALSPFGMLVALSVTMLELPVLIISRQLPSLLLGGATVFNLGLAAVGLLVGTTLYGRPPRR